MSKKEKLVSISSAEQEKQEEKNKGMGFILKTAFSAITMLALLASFTAATYAWFSSNSIVTTNRASGRSGTDSVDLQISRSGGDSFQPENQAALLPINPSNSETLMPVSTADLVTFVSSPGMVDGKAIFFKKIEDESCIYHGRIYLRASSQGHSENAKLALYLDNSQEAGGKLVSGLQGYIENAARLGLTFDGGNARILRLSEEKNPDDHRGMNAVLNGVEVVEGQVINGSYDPMRIEQDPSQPIAQFMVGDDGLAANLSLTPLLMMELNHVYTVDVYFYLEGCDPDCIDVSKLDSLNLHLAFYGVLTEEAN